MLGDWRRIDSRCEIVIEEDPGSFDPVNQLYSVRGLVGKVRVRHWMATKVEVAAPKIVLDANDHGFVWHDYNSRLTAVYKAFARIGDGGFTLRVSITYNEGARRGQATKLRKRIIETVCDELREASAKSEPFRNPFRTPRSEGGRRKYTRAELASALQIVRAA